MIAIGEKVEIINRDYGRFRDRGIVLSKKMSSLGMLFTIKFKDGIAVYPDRSIRKVE